MVLQASPEPVEGHFWNNKLGKLYFGTPCTRRRKWMWGRDYGPVRSAMIRLAGLIFAILVASVACDTLGTPPAAPEGEPAPDVEATVRAVIGSVQSTPQPTAQPGEEVDLQATIIASVQATVEALRSATPIPSPTPTGAPAAQAAPAQATSGNISPTPAVTAVTAPTLQPTATSIPTPTPTPEPTVSPTPAPTPAPAPTLAANCGTVADGTPVTALIDGQAVASSAVQNGAYNIFIDQGDSGQFSGKTVTFKIETLDANESSNWVQGGVSELDLTASPADASSGQPEPTTGPNTPTSVQPREGGLLAQPVPPHFFVGKATIVC